jgi:maltooligosyltrehalose trehalohydrolase
LMWLRDYRFDGLRLDAIHTILDQSAVHILEKLAAEARVLETQTGRNYDLIAESDLNDPRLVRDVTVGGYGLDAAWSDDFHHALHALLTGESAGYYQDFGRVADLVAALTRIYVYDGRYSSYRQRTHGRPVGGIPASRFVVASQNHDQVGNRAAGERLGHLAGLPRAKVAAALLLTAPGVPLLFQGEEWAASTPFQYFTAHEDPDLGRAVSEGRKREFAAFGWSPADVPDPQDPATFERSRLDWDEVPLEPHREMLGWYRDLIALRRAFPDLTDGNLRSVRIEFDEGEHWLTMSRGEVTLALNVGEAEQSLLVPDGQGLKLASDPGIIHSSGYVTLPPDSAAVLIGHP